MTNLYIGKAVHYHSYGTPNGEYMPEPRAALITQLLPDSAVGLAVFNPTGIFLNVSVPFSETPKPGHWNFIPEESNEPAPTSTVEQVLPNATVAVTPPTDASIDVEDNYEETTCGVYKYVDPNDFTNRDRGDFCVMTKGHSGDHTSWSGATWPNYDSVDNG